MKNLGYFTQRFGQRFCRFNLYILTWRGRRQLMALTVAAALALLMLVSVIIYLTSQFTWDMLLLL
jgi:hypothetical protein